MKAIASRLRVQEIALVMILDRWPRTLDLTLAKLAPLVDRKIALLDVRAGLDSLNSQQQLHFDAVEQARSQGLAGLRNESLALARKMTVPDSWALVIDADEQIDPASLVTVREAIASASETAAFLLPQYNYVGHGRWATAYGFRLFRLHAPIEYQHDIHESISSSLIRHGLPWRYLSAPIQHLDFLDPVVGKRPRYKRLLETAIDEGQDLAFLKTLYAMECFWHRENERALAVLDEAIEAAADPIQNRRFGGRNDFPVALKAQYLVHKRAYDQAASLFRHLVEHAETRVRSEAALGLSNIASLQDRPLEALHWIDASLARWPLSEAAFSRATVLAEMGKSQQALGAISLGLQLNLMAGDDRISTETSRESLYVQLSLLNPAYRGLSALLKSMGQPTSAGN
jgi:tetratricopeptide (TPR) repeat protein